MAAQPIQLDEGWNNQLKAKAIDVLIGILDQGLDTVTTRPFPATEFMAIYSCAYNMCTQRSPFNFSEQLYQRHGETITDYLTGTVLPALRNKHDEYLLRELSLRWANHKVMNKWMTLFFMYLDRYYVKHHNLPSLKDAGLTAFKSQVYDAVKEDCVAALLLVVNVERDGGIVDHDLLRSCVEVFESMGLGSLAAYSEDLEEPLLASSREYFARKAQEWIASDSTPEFLRKAEAALEAESRRVGHYLNSASEEKLLGVLEQELLAAHEQTLLDKEGSGCRALLANDRGEDLARIFRLFGRVADGLQPVATIVRDHIRAMGMEVVNRRRAAIASSGKDSTSDPAFVQELIALHDKYRALVNGEFAGNALFQRALKEAFVEFVNLNVGKHTNADMLATFCDRILKTGGEKLSDAQVEEALEKVVQLFGYLNDKDLFSEIYRNQLSKRLLNQRSASDDAERLMIGKLKLRCGAQFTGRMEGMLNDLAMNADHRAKFAEHQAAQEQQEEKTEFDFSVQVLTTGYWPTYKQVDIAVPPVFVRAMSAFQQYYDSTTQHRRLQWVHTHGNATLRGRFGSNAYDVQVTTLQAIVLLAFNEQEGAYSFANLMQALNVPEEILKRLMHSLSCGKHKVLRKGTPSKSISSSDDFTFNASFSCPMRKIRIPMPSLEESHNPKRVEEDRSIAIEASIVRIMKSRNMLRHQELIAEVLQQLSFFSPNPKVIKRRIEALIDREYLSRSDEDASVYHYMA